MCVMSHRLDTLLHHVLRAGPAALAITSLVKKLDRHSIAPSVGNIAFEMKVKGHNVWGLFTHFWVAVHTKKDPGQLGNRILREAGIQ